MTKNPQDIKLEKITTKITLFNSQYKIQFRIYLDTLKLGDVVAFFLGECTTLSFRHVRAFASWNILAFLLLNSLALPLINIIAFFNGNVLAVLGDDITALLGVMNLFTHALGHRATLLAVDSLALAARNVLKNK